MITSVRQFSMLEVNASGQLTIYPVDEAMEADQTGILKQKIINEEYKIWKKHAPFLYDLMLRWAA